MVVLKNSLRSILRLETCPARVLGRVKKKKRLRTKICRKSGMAFLDMAPGGHFPKLKPE